MNLGDSMRRALAVKEARRLHPLSPEEQAEVDRFPAERHMPHKPERGTDGLSSVFDSPPRVR